MLVLAWRQTHETEAERVYTASLGSVRLRSFSIMPAFFWYSLQIVRQLQRTPDVVGYRTAVKIFDKTFYHLSVWEASSAIQTFVHEQPHFRIMQKLLGRLGDVEFRYWTVKGSQLPLVLERELKRLSDA